MRAAETNPPDATALALAALAWTLEDGERARRLLALTGLDAEGLRLNAADPALLAAVIGFLAAHEPDLIACAEALDVTAQALIAAQKELEA